MDCLVIEEKKETNDEWMMRMRKKDRKEEDDRTPHLLTAANCAQIAAKECSTGRYMKISIGILGATHLRQMGDRSVGRDDKASGQMPVVNQPTGHFPGRKRGHEGVTSADAQSTRKRGKKKPNTVMEEKPLRRADIRSDVDCRLFLEGRRVPGGGKKFWKKG